MSSGSKSTIFDKCFESLVLSLFKSILQNQRFGLEVMVRVSDIDQGKVN